MEQINVAYVPVEPHGYSFFHILNDLFFVEI